MNKRHESKYLDKYITYHVEITFKNNKTKNGYLYKNIFKNKECYFLRMPEGDLYFYKSHVKRLVTWYDKSKGVKNE